MYWNECKRGYARSGTYVCQQKVENRPKKRYPLKAPEKLWFIEWSLKVGGRQRKRGRSSYLPSIWTDYLTNLKVAHNGDMEKWCFFSVGEAATSKWTHGEVAVFGSTVYKIFALKCQKLRTPLASLASCIITILSLERKIFFCHKNNKQAEDFFFHSKKILYKFGVILTTLENWFEYKTKER